MNHDMNFNLLMLNSFKLQNKEQNEKIAEVAGSTNELWIGADDRSVEGTFKRTDGESST